MVCYLYIFIVFIYVYIYFAYTIYIYINVNYIYINIYLCKVCKYNKGIKDIYIIIWMYISYKNNYLDIYNSKFTYISHLFIEDRI